MTTWSARSTNIGPIAFAGRIRDHHYFYDVPAEEGGNDVAAMPPESLLSALGSCMGMVVALSCQARDIPYEGMHVQVEAEVNDEQNRLENFHLTIHMPATLSDKQRRAVENAEALCKVRNTLLAATEVHVEIAD